MKHLVFYVAFVGGLLGAARAGQPDSFPGQGRGPRYSPNHPVTTQGLDLSRAPSTEELMSAGQLGGPLFPTRELADPKRHEAARWDFGRAIEAWNRHEYKQAVEMFRKHAKDYPDSPWADEAILHVGCDATYNGRYSEAETIFQQLIASNQGKDHDGARMLLGKARQRLGLLKVAQNNLEEAGLHFTDLLRESPDWRHRTYASHWIQRISRYLGAREALLSCGAEALAYALERAGQNDAAGLVRTNHPATMRGHTMANLSGLAAQRGFEMVALQLAPGDLRRLPLPAVLHIAARNNSDKGHYWVLDKCQGNQVDLFDPQSEHRFSQTIDELAREWSGKALVFAKPGQLPGRRLDLQEMDDAAGGCCGAPRPEGDQGDPGENGGGSGGGGNPYGPSPPPGDPGGDPPGKCSQGAPVWNVNMMNLNLFMKDTPLWYDPPYGPPVQITVSYNSQSATAHNEPFGNKWQFNYGSYLVVDTAGSVLLFMPDGRRDTYAPDGQGGYRKPFGAVNTLTRLAENHFELRFPDDTVYVYRIPPGTSSQQPFLTEIRDAYGNKLTLGYNNLVQLTTVTDAQGKVFALSYNPGGLCTNVADPFGRNARFEYDGNRNLVKITDMGGYWSTLSYDTNVYVTNLGDDRGTWAFWIEASSSVVTNGDTYPPPGEPMWQNYRITVTNPFSQREEYMYYGGCSGYGCAGHSWHVSFRDYVPWEGPTVNNLLSSPPKTLYLPTVVGSGRQGRISTVIYPGGGSVQYPYDATTGQRAGATDSHGHTWRYTYNELGRLTSKTDPAGTLTTYRYASNQVDLLSVSNGLGEIRFSYNAQHDVIAITDALTNTTVFTYNPKGQRTAVVDPLKVTNEYVYNVDGRLAEMRRAGQVLGQFAYDTIGRVRSSTDATSLTVTNEWSDLNQLTRATFPDGRFKSYAYSTCCPRLLDSITDRGGRTTHYIYNSLKQLLQVINPEGGVTQFSYDSNGNLTELKDPNGNPTSFLYDQDDRLVRKVYADGKGPSYTYDHEGLLIQRRNARATLTSYTYDGNHEIVSVTHSDGTPGYTNTYDTFGRVIQTIDGIGTNKYTYDANSRLLSRDGPWANDLITSAYDPAGRRTNLIAEGSSPVGYVHDALGRLANIVTDAGTFTYTYVGASALLQRLSRPGAVPNFTDYTYDPVNRLVRISNRAGPSAQVINEFSYTYNAQDLRDSESTSNGLSFTYRKNEQIVQAHNQLNQMLTASSPSRTFAYDEDGNMVLSYTPPGEVLTATYDAENRLVSAVLTNASGHVLRTEVRYSAANLVSEKILVDNGAVVSVVRSVRDGFLTLQERGAGNMIASDYCWGADLGGGIGGLIRLYRSGTNFTYLYDGKANVVAILDDQCDSVAAYRYDTFGDLITFEQTVIQPYRFATKPRDDVTGLVDFGFRWYAPAHRRWQSRDLLEEAFGINLYTYALNNPVLLIDPVGAMAEYSEAFKEPLLWDFAVELYDPQYLTVAMHGTTRGLPGGVGPEEWAHMIRNDPRWKHRPVKLYVCNAGAGKNSFAQQLADLLGVDVIAGNAKVYVKPNLTTYVGEKGRGRWIRFTPYRTPSHGPF